MYGGEFDGVYNLSIDHFWNWLFILWDNMILLTGFRGEGENSKVDSASSKGKVKEFSMLKIVSNIQIEKWSWFFYF